MNPTAGKALNLNADKLDGLDQSAFLKSNQKATDADKLDGMDSTAFLANNGKAADADKLDGMDSSAFGIKTEHNFVRSDTCDTPNTPNECAKVQVVVPPGKKYLVSVWSVMSWKGGVTQQDISYCSAMHNPIHPPLKLHNAFRTV